MKVVILSGGNGSRFNSDNNLKPKPMIEIGGIPVLIHIMKHFSYYGFNDFVIALGIGHIVVKKYFSEYYLHSSDIEFNLFNNAMTILNSSTEKWKVKLIYTGDNTLTAGRLKRVEKYIDSDNFFVVYGDSLCNLNLIEELNSHINSNKVFTLGTSAFRSQKGVIECDDNNTVISFREKSDKDFTFVNTGYMVSNKKIFRYINSDNNALDKDVFPKLMAEKELHSYFHKGFWHPIEIQKDIVDLNKMWSNGNAEWTNYL